MEHAKEDDAERPLHVVERGQVFSRSLIWELQRSYYAEVGVDAWRYRGLPHYVTCNPTVANSYAEIVFAFLCEQARSAPGEGHGFEPLYLCELGAGPGRFAFHFLKRLTRLCEMSELPPTPFRYVLTDFTQTNLDFWRVHPRFQDFFESRVLDVALFDINESDRLDLQLSGRTITAGSLTRPLVVIANYVLDSVPQELLYVDGGRSHQCLVSLLTDEDPAALEPAALMEHLRYYFECLGPTTTAEEEPALQELLSDYQRTLNDTHLLFPLAALRCLQRLKSLSSRGLFLLSADKGEHTVEGIQGGPPIPVDHAGCFSLNVNYHALKLFCERSGGVALFPTSDHRSIAISGLLMVDQAEDYLETRRAFRRHVQDFGPDDFFTVVEHAWQHAAEMQVESILAYLRLSHYDGYHFSYFLPRLQELAPGLNCDERRAVRAAVDEVWEMHFPLGEDMDLAYESAGLLYEMDDYAGALAYFERSVEIYGEHTGTLFNMAACCQLTGQDARAETLLRKVLRYDPDNQQARALLAGGEA